MKKKQLIIFLSLLLLSLMIRSSLSNLPFLNGKYIYWLFVVVTGSAICLFNDSNKKWILNRFDVCVLILFCIGLWNFMYLSNATVFNLKVWYVTGYLLLYLILRRSLYTKGTILEISKKIYYLIFLAATLNAAIAILQKIQLLFSTNPDFKITGLFYSPNQLALFLAIGILSLIELIKQNKSKLSKILFFICFVILAYGLYLSECRGAYIALIVVILFNMVRFRKRNKELFSFKTTPYIFITLSILLAIIWNLNSSKSESASGRLFITKQSLAQLEKRPLAGYGFDSFSLQYNLAKADYFAVERSWEETRNAGYIYSANNDFLELGFELGAIWIIVFSVFIIMLLNKAKSSNTQETFSSTLLCIIIFAFTNTILPVPLFVVLGCIFTVGIINETEMKPVVSFKQNILFKIIAVIFLVIFSTIIVLRLNAEYKLKKIYNEEEISGLKKTENYASKIDANGEQLFVTGIIFLKNYNREEGLKYLTNGFKQSGKPSLGKNLATIFERMGKYDEAERIYIYNKNVEPFRFDARMDLFNLYLKTNQKQKAREIAKEILYLPIKIPSKNIDLFKEKMNNYLKNEQKKAE
ncbi:MAG: O-antigen ligase family protein [Flavobacterium sp.]